MGATSPRDRRMEMEKRIKTRMNGDEPAVEQHECNGYAISWNPDDERFYVQKGAEFLGSFSLLRNARQWCKKH